MQSRASAEPRNVDLHAASLVVGGIALASRPSAAPSRTPFPKPSAEQI